MAAYNYRSPSYNPNTSDLYNEDNNPNARTNGPGLGTGSLTPVAPLNTAGNAQPTAPLNDHGHWIGNQWVDDSIIPPPDATTGQGINESGVTSAPPPPETVQGAYNDTIQTLLTSPAQTNTATTTPTQAPASTTLPEGQPQTPPPSSTSINFPAPPPAAVTTPTLPASIAPSVTLPSSTSPINDAYHQRLLDLLNGPTEQEAGAAAGQDSAVQAFRMQRSRQLDQERAKAAEQSGLNGTQGSGGFEGNIQGLKQAAGEDTAVFAGNEATTAMAARRQELMQAMQMAQSAGQFDQAQALQAQIANMDAVLKQKGIDLQAQQNANALALGQESNANQRYATEIQKLLGLSDVDARKLIAQMQNSTEMYGINSTANTAANALGLGYTTLGVNNAQWYIDRGLTPPAGAA